MFSKIKQNIEKNFLHLLKGSNEFDSKRLIRSPRAVGDMVQDLAEEYLADCIDYS